MRRLLASLPKKDRLKAGQGTALRGVWRYIVSTLNGVTVSRASTRTVMGYASDATIADGQSLLTVPANIGAYPGQRLATTVADGARLGDELIQNPNFESSTGWSLGAGWTILGGQATHNGANSTIFQTKGVVGERGQLIVDMDSITAGQITLRIGNNYSQGRISGGVYTFEAVADSTIVGVTVADSGGQTVLNSISYRKVEPTYKTYTDESIWRNYVAVGDSITAASGDNYLVIGSRLKGYFEPQNAGVSGNTLGDMWARWATDVVALSPDVVTVLGGLNDIQNALVDPVPGMMSIVEDMYASAVANSFELYFISPPPFKDAVNWTETRQGYLIDYIDQLTSYCNFNGINILNIYNLLVSSDGESQVPEYTTDKLHLTYLGHRVVSSGLLALVNSIQASIGNPVEVDIEDVATNLLLNSSAPATQTVDLSTGNHTLQCIGSGAVVASANTAAISGESSATEGSPNTFNVTGAGTVDITVTGSLDYFQLETGTYASPIIITAGASAARAADQASTATPPLLSTSTGAQRIEFTPHQAGQVDKTITAFYVDATHKMELTINATQVLASYTDGANTDSAAFTYSHVADTAAYVDWYWDSAANEIGVRAAHTSGNIDGETFATATFAGLTSLPATQQLGHENGAAVFSGTIGDLDIFYASKSDAGW